MCVRCRKLREYDLFGAPIGLTFEGEAKYKTRVGGFVSLIICILFGGTLISNIVAVYTNREFKQNMVHKYN